MSPMPDSGAEECPRCLALEPRNVPDAWLWSRGMSPMPGSGAEECPRCLTLELRNVPGEVSLIKGVVGGEMITKGFSWVYQRGAGISREKI